MFGADLICSFVTATCKSSRPTVIPPSGTKVRRLPIDKALLDGRELRLVVLDVNVDLQHLRQVDRQGRRPRVLPRTARDRQRRPRLPLQGRLRRAAARRALALRHLPNDPDQRRRRQRRPRGDRLKGRRRPTLLPDFARHPRRRGLETDRQRLHRADHQGTPDGVRGRDEPTDRATDGGLNRLAALPRQRPRCGSLSMAAVKHQPLPSNADALPRRA
jgi:hypothetical protein